jgi:hypothetical protein
MTVEEFRASLAQATPPEDLPAPVTALWWDAKGNWVFAHALVDDLSTPKGMAVHAYLHRKEGADWNADYWYSRAGRRFKRPTLEAEWEALIEGLLRSEQAS